MEITISDLISVITLLAGGSGLGWWLTWKYTKRKEKAEANQAEASAAKELQDMYQQMVADAKADREDRKAQNEELRAERDHYKQERNDLREEINRLTKSVAEWKSQSDKKILDLQRQVARNGRQLEAIRPFVCADMQCKRRQLVTISDDGVVDTEKTLRPAPQGNMEPIANDEL